ncbi:methionyl-tRNA formyltransferase [Candidatus Azobacteroides pseudotrichonymphae]|uniref:Methionyl-tRNA formyltransferase n=1 Tax=Azobacteroides pseudotrichonymphae genomovar. CFP2 TaxID=511995 RepID=FMT_AZOPC|nr:methionyl-tRNA formyltransferase [Candidatus Azobacteroides pseudotrichonymphae]B6YQF1.1 RecName: Full=Methionyl-tRNA formyltransferase [Candidatus Azobacteroides pseudotrichonymphae genomovar. CFP2]BAG83423.1 methionyl-tRNA formyltransferase [Candidatus Azobacteroides pseudotrichonymphae genomovar. CFP2]
MTASKARIVFMGTPDFAVASLDALIGEGYNVVGVVTIPDKSIGKHQSIPQFSPIKQYALSHEIPLLQPKKLKDPDFLKSLKAWNTDLQVVVSFRLLPEVVWNMPSLGTFNLHASLLPQYRGAAPINWAIINGEKETGVTTFFLDYEIDTGKIIAQECIPIKETDNAGTIHDELMYLGAKLVVKTTNDILSGTVKLISQDETNLGKQKLKIAPKIFREVCKIDWNKTTREIHNFIRGLSPYPGAWTELTCVKGMTFPFKIFETEKADCHDYSLPVGTIVSDKKVYIDVRTKDGFIRLRNVQLAGKKRMPVTDFLKGNAYLLSLHF